MAPDLDHVRGALPQERKAATSSAAPEKGTGSYHGVEYALLHESDGLRTTALIPATAMRSARRSAGSPGSGSRARPRSPRSAPSPTPLGFFDWGRKDYDRTLIEGAGRGALPRRRRLVGARAEAAAAPARGARQAGRHRPRRPPAPRPGASHARANGHRDTTGSVPAPRPRVRSHADRAWRRSARRRLIPTLTRGETPCEGRGHRMSLGSRPGAGDRCLTQPQRASLRPWWPT